MEEKLSDTPKIGGYVVIVYSGNDVSDWANAHGYYKDYSEAKAASAHYATSIDEAILRVREREKKDEEYEWWESRFPEYVRILPVTEAVFKERVLSHRILSDFSLDFSDTCLVGGVVVLSTKDEADIGRNYSGGRPKGWNNVQSRLRGMGRIP